eukprot:Plantae.Rhodophyta-Hildenbrandia_rubra.ctg14524.p1 GENE.Plantae.Rhodophyta-Hildenbrandia_rubra.ctg14524~~Plantae.Rhodophyta-Hildenbrandia_rubra.ctg14524.p1  ORF type:complete len:561 (-),score=73.90 Plantae.Rhodophyta-Hildenbrandia_rubra.ctg14524:1646-3328(-)
MALAWCCSSVVPIPSTRGSKIRRSPSCSQNDVDVVVIGSGIGGLCAASILAHCYNKQVLVLESHSIPGGAAHSFKRGPYTFDSGPHLFSGLNPRGPSQNPLAYALRAIEEDFPIYDYRTWGCYFPEGAVAARLGDGGRIFGNLFESLGERAAEKEVKDLSRELMKLARLTTAVPPAALRAGDVWGSIRSGLRCLVKGNGLKDLVTSDLRRVSQLNGPFRPLLEEFTEEGFARNFMELLAFLLSGTKSDGIPTAEMAFMFSEWAGSAAEEGRNPLEFPVGGAGKIVEALVRGVEKDGRGRVICGAHVQEIIVSEGKAVGVRLVNGDEIVAKEAVISNASLWNTQNLLGKEFYKSVSERLEKVTMCPSFVHLHLGIDCEGIDIDDLEINYCIVNSWKEGVDAPQNVVLMSIPSIADPSVCPTGHATLHAYTPATEPYKRYERMSRNTDEYRKFKKDRCDILWKAIERVIPDIRSRAEVILEGTPLTHERYLRRSRGTYGPLVQASKGLLPGQRAIREVDALYCVGDSTFPGIGVPAVAASGFMAANGIAGAKKHRILFDRIF